MACPVIKDHILVVAADYQDADLDSDVTQDAINGIRMPSCVLFWPHTASGSLWRRADVPASASAPR